MLAQQLRMLLTRAWHVHSLHQAAGGWFQRQDHDTPVLGKWYARGWAG